AAAARQAAAAARARLN
ncbi:hypothetical protein, partial [Frankia torreyi]